jgi:hypothetical protein
MVDAIINNSLLNAINTQNINSQNLGQGASASQAANINSELPNILLGTPLNATVTTNPQLGQVSLNVPQLASFLPQAEVLVTTNQTQLQQGQQVQIQLPEATNFTRLNNTLIANINIATTDANTGATQNFNGRINIVLPNQPSSNASNNQFIQQNISNPESLVGKNFQAFFISAPDKNFTQNLVQNISSQPSQVQVLQGVAQSSLVPENISGLQIKISNITLPDVASSSANIPAAPASSSNLAATANFAASVVFSGDNETILNTNLGTLRLPVNLQLPVGSNIQFDISSLDLKNVAVGKELQITNLESLKQYLASDATALKDLLSALTNNQNTSPQAGVSQAQAQVPNVTDKFIFSRAIWFLGNVANSSPDKWLSEDSKKILSKNNLLAEGANKLEGVFKAFKSFFTPAEGLPQGNIGAWNNFVVPFLDSENKLNYVNFFTEQNSKNNNYEGEKSALRFIVELNNSYFGDVQIDGLLTNSEITSLQQNSSKKLDVIFRYSSQISDSDKLELQKIFIDSLEISGLKGEISFRQSSVDEFPRPQAQNEAKLASPLSKNGYVI